MSILINLIGKQFGLLVVIRRMDNDKLGNSRWLCRCNCKDGKEIIVSGQHLKNGHTKSCGCLRKEKTRQRFMKHGYSSSKIYSVWKEIIQRCTNPNHKRWKDYGGRGIKVCERWLKFENFLEDMGENWKLGLTIERKNNKKGYYKENCKWATSKEQNRNSRNNRLETYKGKTQCLAAWAEEYDIIYNTLWDRLYRYGWSIEKALTTPVRKKRNKSNEEKRHKSKR